MKSIALFGLLAAFADAAVIARQEHGHADGAMPAPKKSPPPSTKGGVRAAYKIEKMEPKILPEAKRVKITYGPFKLRGTESSVNPGNTPNMDPAGTAYSDALGLDFPRDVMIITTKTTLVNSTWQNAYVTDGYYNHHAAFISTEKRGDPDWFRCDGKPVPDMTPYTIFMGAEAVDLEIPLTEQSNKLKSGFYVGPKDTLMLGVEIVNYNKDDRDVYTVSEVEYVSGQPKDFAQGDTRQIPMGVCDGDQKSWMESMNIHAPKDSKKFVLGGKKEMEIQRDGYLRTAYAHLHDGGSHMIMTLNGKEVCKSTVMYGGPGHEQKLPNGELLKTIGKTVGCVDPLKVRKGDKMQLYAHFDFDAHPARQSAHGEESEAMALGLMTFVPDLKSTPF